MEIEIINGVEWRRDRYSNGLLWYEIPSVNEELHGLVRRWYPNGQLWYQTPYVNGHHHGLYRRWHENGQLWFVRLYNNGRLVFEINNPPQTQGKWKLK